ncbi:hypothetical protein GCM10027610_064340 [Dactylosporangium cerinum]
MDMHILAIDQGTSGTKAIVTGADGTVLAIAEEPLRPGYLAGGAVEQDPLALLDSVFTAGRRAGAAAGVPSTRSPWPTRAKRSSRGTGTPERRSPRPWSGRTDGPRPSAPRGPNPPGRWRR